MKLFVVLRAHVEEARNEALSIAGLPHTLISHIHMASKPQISERFCAADADIMILSSDGVLFKLHRKHLEVHSEVFADAEKATLPVKDDIVQLSESSDVLDLLFQYMYRQPQPDLRALDFRLVSGLAEAVEKYIVYSALPSLVQKMKGSIDDHPLEVLAYSWKHGYDELAKDAGPKSMSKSMAEAIDVLGYDDLKKWLLFHETWHSNAKALLASRLARHNCHYGQLANDVCLLVGLLRDANPWLNQREGFRVDGGDLNELEMVGKITALNFTG
ncbi:hypothetical protein C8J57DRAFT_1116411 [Mycena rebaudengoi]|nr:hypothetical protein C8J57DRAFT_1116411 [Mycena rebaudengoi]